MANPKSGPMLLPKRAREEIARIMAEGGDLDLPNYLSKWFAKTEEDFLTWPNWNEKILQNLYNEWEMKRPHLSADQRFHALSFHFVEANINDFALARRWALNDPSELATGRFVANRIQWINWGCRACNGFILVDLLTVRDSELAAFLADKGDIVAVLPNDPFTIATDAVLSIIRKDRDSLQEACGRMRKRKVKGHEQGWFTTVMGICDGRPEEVAKGLQSLLNPKRRDEWAECNFWAFFPEAHGLYRLAESVESSLVSEFDVTQSYPWDAEFHAWTQTHENPIADLDLNSISPVLHDAVVNLSPPPWLVWTAEDERRREADLSAPCDLWLIDLGPHPDDVRRLISENADLAVHSEPMLIRTGVPRITALGTKFKLQAKGATVELREPDSLSSD